METGDANSVFVDTNILVYAAVSTAPRHEESRRELERLHAAGRTLWISRQVLREYASVLTRPQSFAAPLPNTVVADDLRRLAADFSIAEDGPQVTERLATLLQEVAIGGKQVHDANIVATMLATDIPTLLTANSADFHRFHDLVTVVGLPDA
jgi:predicted nucleic acid-binding protein